MAGGQQADFGQGSLGETRTVSLRSRKTGGGSATFALTGSSVSLSQGAFDKSRTKALTGSAITSATGSLSTAGGSSDWSQRIVGAFMANRLDTSAILSLRLLDGTQDHITLDTGVKVTGAAGSAKFEVRNADSTGSGQISVPFGREIVVGQWVWTYYRVRQEGNHIHQPWPGTSDGSKLSIVSRDANGTGELGSNQLNEVVIQNNNQGAHVSGYRRNGNAQGQTDFLAWDVAFSSNVNSDDGRAQPARDRGANPLTGTNPDTGAAWTAWQQERARYGLTFGARSSPGAPEYAVGGGDPFSGGFRARANEWVGILQGIYYGTRGEFASRVITYAHHEGGTYELLWNEHNVVLGNGPNPNALNLLPYTADRISGGRQASTRTNAIPGVTINSVALSTPIGDGTLTYNASTQRFTWAGSGQSAGTARGFSSANGILVINVKAATTSSYLVIQVDPTLLPTSGTHQETVTIANGRPTTNLYYTEAAASYSPIVEPGAVTGSSGLSVLAKTAALMAPGTWAPLTTINLASTVLVGGSTLNMLPFQNNGVWDPVRGLVHVLGNDHSAPNMRHIQYSEATNTWSLASTAPVSHGYDHLNIDVTTGDLYMWEYHYGAGGGIWRKTPTGSWDTNYGSRDFHTNVASGTCIWTGPLTGFSDTKGVLIAMEGDFGIIAGKGVSSLNTAAAFTVFADVNVTQPGYHLNAAYSRIKNVAVMGGGNEQPRRLWKMTSSRIVSELGTAPVGCEIGTQHGSLTEDPVTGNFLIMTGGNLYELNPDGSGTYTLQTGSRVPPALVNTFDTTPNSACIIPIDTYGVSMVISADSGSSANVFLYKHA